MTTRKIKANHIGKNTKKKRTTCRSPYHGAKVGVVVKMGLLKRLIHGGPKYQERQKQKQIDRETYGTPEWRKDQLKKAEQESEFKGELAGRRERGYMKGKARGKAGGGLLGSLTVAANTFEAGGKTLTAGVDFGGIGQGFNLDGTFGLGNQQRRHRKSKKRRR